MKPHPSLSNSGLVNMKLERIRGSLTKSQGKIYATWKEARKYTPGVLYDGATSSIPISNNLPSSFEESAQTSHRMAFIDSFQ